MSRMMLSRLVGIALVDKDFCEGLMNGKRSALLAEFDLTDEEREMMASFETDSVQELASSVHNWLTGNEVADPPQVGHNAIQAV